MTGTQPTPHSCETPIARDLIPVLLGTLVNIMGLTSIEDALLRQAIDNVQNNKHRNAAAGYVSAWIRCR
jgi:hypothetical protein